MKEKIIKGTLRIFLTIILTEMELNENVNELFPVFLKLDKKRLLIVGGGNIALEKLTALLNNSPGTNIILVAPQIQNAIKKLAASYRNVTLIEKEYSDGDLITADIAIVAAGDRALSERVKKAAEQRNIFVNVADTPDLCDFYLGSIVSKGDLKIAISTNGKSPTLAKRLRQYFDKYIPEDILVSIDNLNRFRSRLTGDFSFKVKKLNEATEILLSDEESNINGN